MDGPENYPEDLLLLFNFEFLLSNITALLLYRYCFLCLQLCTLARIWDSLFSAKVKWRGRCCCIFQRPRAGIARGCTWPHYGRERAIESSEPYPFLTPTFRKSIPDLLPSFPKCVPDLTPSLEKYTWPYVLYQISKICTVPYTKIMNIDAVPYTSIWKIETLPDGTSPYPKIYIAPLGWDWRINRVATLVIKW